MARLTLGRFIFKTQNNSVLQNVKTPQALPL
jgi:hypothetical protein